MNFHFDLNIRCVHYAVRQRVKSLAIRFYKPISPAFNR